MTIKLSSEQFSEVLKTFKEIKAEQKPTNYYSNCSFNVPVPILVKDPQSTPHQEKPEAKADDMERLIRFIQDKTGFEYGQIEWTINLINEYYEVK